MRLRPPVSRSAACRAVSTTARIATTTVGVKRAFSWVGSALRGTPTSSFFQHLSRRHVTFFLRRVAPLLTVATIAACASGLARRTAGDEAADRAALLRLHAEQRTAHLLHRADLLVAGQADTLWNVSSGRVSPGPREQVRASFQRYFDASTFSAWDDIAPPRIRISADGRMAWVIVEKRVHVTIAPSRGGAPVVQQVRYAWLSVYEKIDGRWQMTAIASTERPDST